MKSTSATVCDDWAVFGLRARGVAQGSSCLGSIYRVAQLAGSRSRALCAKEYSKSSIDLAQT
ncbi:MAG: hypothetical protein AB8B87_22375 [Granulosicoccus sp.]